MDETVRGPFGGTLQSAITTAGGSILDRLGDSDSDWLISNAGIPAFISNSWLDPTIFLVTLGTDKFHYVAFHFSVNSFVGKCLAVRLLLLPACRCCRNWLQRAAASQCCFSAASASPFKLIQQFHLTCIERDTRSCTHSIVRTGWQVEAVATSLEIRSGSAHVVLGAFGGEYFAGTFMGRFSKDKRVRACRG